MDTLEKQRKKLKLYRIRVFIGALCTIGAVGGLFGNTTGVLFSAIIDDLGFSTQSLSLYYTIKSLIAGFASTILTRLYLKTKHVKIMVFSYGIFLVLSYAVMSLYSIPVYWYISAFVAGIACFASSIQPFVLKNWYREKMSKFIGPMYMATGIMGALWSPILSGLIKSMGWRSANLISSIVGTVLVICGTILVVKDPKDVGINIDEIEEREIKPVDLKSFNGAAPSKYPFRSYAYVFIAIVGGSMGYQMASYIPQFTNSLGYDISFGALLTSVVMIGNMSSKFLVGFVTSKFGTRKGFGIYTSFVLIAFLLYIFTGFSQITLVIASLMLGCSYAIGATAWTTISMDVFDSRNFEMPYSKLIMYSNIYFAGIIYLLGLFKDITGSFYPDFIWSAVFCAISAVVLFFVSPVKKQKE